MGKLKLSFKKPKVVYAKSRPEAQLLSPPSHRNSSKSRLPLHRPGPGLLPTCNKNSWYRESRHFVLFHGKTTKCLKQHVRKGSIDSSLEKTHKNQRRNICLLQIMYAKCNLPPTPHSMKRRGLLKFLYLLVPALRARGCPNRTAATDDMSGCRTLHYPPYWMERDKYLWQLTKE